LHHAASADSKSRWSPNRKKFRRSILKHYDPDRRNRDGTGDCQGMNKTKIVIAGGGFAGLAAATYLDKRLARRADTEVVLISRENFILFTPMLHEVAAGDLYPSDIINPLRRILRHVKIVQADVKAIDPSERRVRCSAGVAQLEFQLEFDHLLLALGSETNFLDLPGLSDWAVTMKPERCSAATQSGNCIAGRGDSANRCGHSPAVTNHRHRGWRLFRSRNSGRHE
jgi:Pyridine nucleotide-disulphide oxidoreductase